MSSTLKSRPEILIFGARDWILQKFHSTIHSINVSTDRESARAARRSAEYRGKWWELTTRLKQHFLPMTQGAARALLYLVVAYQPDYFGMPISQLTFVEGCVSDLFFSTTKLKRVISDKLVKDMFEVRNLFECVDYKSKSSTPANPREYLSRAGGMKVEVRGLSFAYREGKNVLNDVNFVIEPGQIVSIVGYNGSGSPPRHTINIVGKSTLIRLLTLIEKPSQGQILINDVDVTQYDAQIVRTKMSVLFQDFRTHLHLRI
jgi:ABC-type multidrug transport system fused ATPase/permease subunit